MIRPNSSRLTAASIALLAVASVAVFVTAFAWACSPQAYIASLSTSSGPAGSSVTVTGRAFIADQAVRISVASQLVGTAPTNANGDFTAAISIPADTPAGTATIVVVPTNNTQYSASAAFTVTAPVTQQPPGSGATGAPADATPAPAAAAPGAAAQPAAAPQPATPAASAGKPKPSPAARPQATNAPRQPAATGAPATARPQQPAAAATGRSAPQAASSGSAATQQSAAPAGRSGTSLSTSGAQRSFDSGPGAAAAAPSQATASGDVWSGYTSGERPSLSGGPTPLPAAESPTALTLGTAILGVGLVLLLGGVAVAELRRRRAQVGAP